MWADDNPALVLGELTLRENAVEWRRRKAACWEKAFLKLPIPELKKVLCYAVLCLSMILKRAS